MAVSAVSTEEAVNPLPGQPSFNPDSWKYHAEIPQTPVPGDPNHYSLLSHLRHLLAADASLAKIGLKGGLDAWLARNIQEVLALTRDSKNDWHRKDALAVHHEIISILDYLDGSFYVQTDVPPGTPMLVDPPLAQLGLFFGASDQETPGYLPHSQQHVRGVMNSPGVTPDQQGLASHIYSDLNAVSNWLDDVHLAAKQLVAMSDTQLLQPSSFSLLEDMTTQAQYAYNGRSGSSSGKSIGGFCKTDMNLIRRERISATDLFWKGGRVVEARMMTHAGLRQIHTRIIIRSGWPSLLCCPCRRSTF